MSPHRFRWQQSANLPDSDAVWRRIMIGASYLRMDASQVRAPRAATSREVSPLTKICLARHVDLLIACPGCGYLARLSVRFISSMPCLGESAGRFHEDICDSYLIHAAIIGRLTARVFVSLKDRIMASSFGWRTVYVSCGSNGGSNSIGTSRVHHGYRRPAGLAATGGGQQT